MAQKFLIDPAALRKRKNGCAKKSRTKRARKFRDFVKRVRNGTAKKKSRDSIQCRKNCEQQKMKGPRKLRCISKKAKGKGLTRPRGKGAECEATQKKARCTPTDKREKRGNEFFVYNRETERCFPLCTERRGGWFVQDFRTAKKKKRPGVRVLRKRYSLNTAHGFWERDSPPEVEREEKKKKNVRLLSKTQYFLSSENGRPDNRKKKKT